MLMASYGWREKISCLTEATIKKAMSNTTRSLKNRPIVGLWLGVAPAGLKDG